MYARVVISQLIPGNAKQAIAIWRDKLIPVMKEAKGFKGAYILGNRETGEGMTVTFWETEADADAMNSSFRVTIGFFEGLFAAPPELSQMEVLLQV